MATADSDPDRRQVRRASGISPTRDQPKSAAPLPCEPPPPGRALGALLSPGKALALGVGALILELLLILPVFDKLAEHNPTAHFTQHGGIFLGGVLMGVALRDMFLASRR